MFRFVGSGGYIFNVARFRFQDLLPEAKSLGRVVAANLFDQESAPGAAPVVIGSNGITDLTGGSWVSYDNFNFGTGANLITVLAATPNKGGGIEVRTGSSSGLLFARLDVTHAGSWTNFREYTSALLQPVSGIQNLYLRFVDANGQSGSLFNLQNYVVEKKAAPPVLPANQGTLKVYEPVTGLDPSLYYTYSVQKVSALNAPLKQNATNWLTPFAWFSECKRGSDPFSTAYYSQEIAGWSHTYCNFELGKNTPIVVKITRTPNPFGAPAGPIFMANAHPAHKVQSCEIQLGGAVIGATDYWEIGTYPDGTKNTAQHVIYRNIRVTDPRPTRNLFEMHRGMAGMRFENVEYRHPHSWNWDNRQSSFTGTPTEPVSHCCFDGVFVEGKKMDAALIADPTLFHTSNISDFFSEMLPFPCQPSLTC